MLIKMIIFAGFFMVTYQGRPVFLLG